MWAWLPAPAWRRSVIPFAAWKRTQKKLKTLQDGHCPIFEPGLQELMQENYASGQLQFTDDVKSAVKDAEVVFLCVGTPPKPDGTVDMSFLEGAGKEVCDALAEQNNEYMVTIIVKSTVPPGTNRKLYNFLREQTKAYVQVVSNPEFLKEGTAVQGLPEARSHRHRRRIARGVPHDAAAVRSARQARRKLPDDELGIGRADQVRRQLACSRRASRS